MKKTQKLVSYKFISLIVVLCLATLFLNLRVLAWHTLKDYKTDLPEKATVLDHVNGIITGFEKGTNDVIFGKELFLEVYGFYNKMTNHKIIKDVNPVLTVYKMNNDQLTFNYPLYDVSCIAENTIKFMDELETLNIPSYYVQTPFKINKYDNQLPYLIDDTTNINADNFLEYLRQKDKSVIDLRELFQLDESIVYENLFFDTDHHWKPAGALEAVIKVNDILFERGHSFNKVTKSDYETLHASRDFIGSQGKRVGKIYGSSDSFEYIIPKKQYNYEVTMLLNDDLGTIRKNGEFENALMFNDILQSSEKYENLYASYLGGDNAYVRIVNNTLEKGKIIIFSDSFGITHDSLITSAYAEVVMVDLRYFNTESVIGIVKKENELMKVDVVLIMYNPGVYQLKTESMFEFY